MKQKSLQLTFLGLILVALLALSVPLFAAPGGVTVEFGSSEECFNPNFSRDRLESLDENGLADPDLLLRADPAEQPFVLCQGQVNLLLRAIYSQDTTAYTRLLSRVTQAKVQRLLSFCKENYPSLAYDDSGQKLIGVSYSEGSLVDGSSGYLVVDFYPNAGDASQPLFVTFYFSRFADRWEITDILLGKPSDGEDRSGVISSSPLATGRPSPPRPEQKDLPFNPLLLSGFTWVVYQAIKQRKSLKKIVASFWEDNKYNLLSGLAIKVGDELAQKKTLVQKLGQIMLEPKHPFFSKAFKFLDDVSGKIDKLGTIPDFALPIIEGIRARDWKLAARGCLKAAFSAGGAALGGKIGAKVGLAIGTALGGPIGGAIGAVVGNVAGSWLGSMGGELVYNLAEKYVPRFVTNAKTAISKALPVVKSVVTKAGAKVAQAAPQIKAVVSKAASKASAVVSNVTTGAKTVISKVSSTVSNTAKQVRSFFSKGLNLFNKPFWR